MPCASRPTSSLRQAICSIRRVEFQLPLADFLDVVGGEAERARNAARYEEDDGGNKQDGKQGGRNTDFQQGVDTVQNVILFHSDDDIPAHLGQVAEGRQLFDAVPGIFDCAVFLLQNALHPRQMTVLIAYVALVGMYQQEPGVIINHADTGFGEPDLTGGNGREFFKTQLYGIDADDPFLRAVDGNGHAQQSPGILFKQRCKAQTAGKSRLEIRLVGAGGIRLWRVGMRQHPAVGGQNRNGGHLRVGFLKGLEFRQNLGHQRVVVLVAPVAAIIFQHAAQTGQAGFLGQRGMHHVQESLHFPSLPFDGKGHFFLYKAAHVLFCNKEADTCEKQKDQYAGNQNAEQHFLKDAKLHGDSSLLDTPVLSSPFL